MAPQSTACRSFLEALPEVLPTQPPSPPETDKRTLEIGDVVMIVDPQLPRALWPVGKISQVFLGADGRVRAANVEVKGRTYTRIVARLILLPALPEDD